MQKTGEQRVQKNRLGQGNAFDGNNLRVKDYNLNNVVSKYNTVVYTHIS